MEKAVRRGEVWKGLVREGGETELNSLERKRKRRGYTKTDGIHCDLIGFIAHTHKTAAITMQIIICICTIIQQESLSHCPVYMFGKYLHAMLYMLGVYRKMALGFLAL